MYYEHSSSSYSTPQFGAGSGVNRSWEKFATAAAQDLSCSTATSTCSHSTLVPTPAYSTPQPCTRSGKKHNRERDAILGYFWAELQTPAWVTHRFAVTTQASHASTAPPLGQGMHSKTKEPDRTQPSGLLLQQLGRRPHPRQGSNSCRAKRKPCRTSSTGSGHHNTNHIPYQGDNNWHTIKKDMAGIHTKASS